MLFHAPTFSRSAKFINIKCYQSTVMNKNSQLDVENIPTDSVEQRKQQGHMAIGTNGYELRRSKRERKPNKKYSLG